MLQNGTGLRWAPETGSDYNSSNNAANVIQRPLPLKAKRRDASVQCLSCGRTVARNARQQNYCSTKCRKRNWGKKRCRKAGLTTDTREATNSPKLVSKINSVRVTKSGPIPPVFGLAHIIHAEVFAGRKWKQVTSQDGVTCLVAQAVSP